MIEKNELIKKLLKLDNVGLAIMNTCANALLTYQEMSKGKEKVS